MPKYSETRIKFLISVIPKFEQFVIKRIGAYEHANGSYLSKPYISEIEYETDRITYCIVTYYRGDADQDCGSMPIEYLWEDNWLNIALAEKKRKEEEAKCKEIADAKKAQIRNEQRQRQRYEELKEKYGDTTH